MGKLTEAVSSGSKKAILLSLRDSIAETIEGSNSGRDVAALSKRLIEVCELIDTLPDERVNPIDAMAAEVEEYDDGGDEDG